MKVSININRSQQSGAVSAAFLVLGIALAEILSFKPAFGTKVEFAQIRGYSASGTHKCGPEKGHSCVVTGSGFTNCNDASIFLQTRDCCPTAAKAGKSSGFTLNYCIPDRVP
jgi:hypothetical protein